MAGDLKPCPFCGANYARTTYVRDGRRTGCPICGASAGIQFHGPADQPSAEDRAAAAWNRRAPTDAPDLTWFWEIVDREGFAPVPSDERNALALIVQDNDRLRERVRDLEAALEKTVSWARGRCPCDGELPDPCTLCGARADSDPCRSVEAIFPTALLAEIDAALSEKKEEESR